MTTAVVVWTMADEGSVSPHGTVANELGIGRDLPFTSRADAVLFVNRLLDDRQERLVHLLELGARLRPHVDVHAHVGGDRVDRGAAADGADIERRLWLTGTVMRENFAMALPIA